MINSEEEEREENDIEVRAGERRVRVSRPKERRVRG